MKNTMMTRKNTMKQVIVIRKDLNMRKGKMVAQGAHASLAAVLRTSFNTVHDFKDSALDMDVRVIPLDEVMDQWLNGTFTKICVSCDSGEELQELYQKVIESDAIEHYAIIEDVGKTEFNGVVTPTCIAIGPAPSEEIDKITGHLKLL
jgi:PTH2 family peptidyl-tRNA hydrolase